MSDYSTGKIYQVVAPDGSIYVGSTICRLNTRFNGHKTQYNRWKLGKGRNCTIFSIFDNNDISNCKIELLEVYPCNSRRELESREGYFIQTLNCVNKVVVGRDQKTWRQENPEKLKEYRKTYNNANREKLNQKKTKYYIDNSDSIKDKRKNYVELNRDLINERNRARYHEKKNNIQKLSEYNELHPSE